MVELFENLTAGERTYGWRFEQQLSPYMFVRSINKLHRIIKRWQL